MWLKVIVTLSLSVMLVACNNSAVVKKSKETAVQANQEASDEAVTGAEATHDPITEPTIIGGWYEKLPIPDPTLVTHTVNREFDSDGFETIEQLATSFAYLFIGQVEHVDYYKTNKVITFSRVKVTKSIYGSLAAGTRITIMEDGGIVFGEDGQVTDILFDGVRAMRVGDTVLLFAEKFDPSSDMTGDLYYVFTHWSKFRIDGANVERAIEQEYMNSANAPTRLRMSMDEFTQRAIAARKKLEFPIN